MKQRVFLFVKLNHEMYQVFFGFSRFANWFTMPKKKVTIITSIFSSLYCRYVFWFVHYSIDSKNCNKCCLSRKLDCSFRPSLNKSVNWPLFYCHVDRYCPKPKRLVHYSPHIWSNVRLMAPANGSFFRTSSFSNEWSSVWTLNGYLVSDLPMHG